MQKSERNLHPLPSERMPKSLLQRISKRQKRGTNEFEIVLTLVSGERRTYETLEDLILAHPEFFEA